MMSDDIKRENYRIIGKKVDRVEGLLKVCGESKYINDIVFDKMLYVGLVTAGISHGIYKSVDLSSSIEVPGVVGTVTHEDIPGENEMGDVIKDYPALLSPGDRISYVGDYVAYIAAESEDAAKKAVELAVVEYEILDPLLDIDAALRNTTVIRGSSNVKTHNKVRKGITDNDAMFSECDFIIEGEFFADYQEQAYLETQGVIAIKDYDNIFTIYGSMQCPYYVQDGVARVLGLPVSNVRVVQTETGGGFGGKEDVPTYFAIPAALVAEKFGRPAKLVLTREQDLQLTSKRHPIKSKYKVGYTDYGRIRSVKVEAYGDMGAHATLSPIVLWRSSVHAAGAYNISNVCVDVYGVYTNKVPCGAYRGFGSPQVFFAMESIVDQIAQKLEMDPIYIRRINALEKGISTPTGHFLREAVGAKETLGEVERMSDWDNLKIKVEKFNSENKFKKLGLGVSHIHYGVALGAMGQHLDASGAFVQIYKDGTVGVRIGGTEMGQGAKTVMALIASEILGIDISKIKVYQPDTSYMPDSGPTVASRTTIFSGNAVKKACEELLSKMLKALSEIWNVSQNDISVGNGFFSSGKDEEKSMAFEEAANVCDRMNIGLSSKGWFETPRLHWDPEKGFGEAYVTYSFASNIVLSCVNILTGEVEVKEVYASHDVGKAINIDGIYGQVHGGFVQGMGYAIFEEIKHDSKGRIITDNFNTLTIPTIQDIPEIFRVSVVEAPFSAGPFGAKGIGEPALIPAPAAVANSVSNAIGKRVTKIPVSKEDILNLIE